MFIFQNLSTPGLNTEVGPGVAVGVGVADGDTK